MVRKRTHDWHLKACTSIGVFLVFMLLYHIYMKSGDLVLIRSFTVHC